MTRAMTDTTSTCGSCSYWEHNKAADGLHPTRLGWCNWVSVPVWVDRLSKQPLSADHRKIREDDGKQCWLHTMREIDCTCGIGNNPSPPRAHTRDCAKAKSALTQEANNGT